MASLEDAVKDKLQIKWVDARQLVGKARDKVGADAEKHEVFAEATKLFSALPKKEQDRMRLAAEKPEPAWRQRAIEQATKREQQWAAVNAPPATGPKEKYTLADGELDKEKTISKKTTTSSVTVQQATPSSDPDGKHIKHTSYSCMCVIL